MSQFVNRIEKMLRGEVLTTYIANEIRAIVDQCEKKDPYEVVINHTDPTQIKTALALAEKKLARAEKLNKVMYEALKKGVHILKWASDNRCECDPDVGMAPCEACWHLDLANNAIAQYDKQLEAILKPATFLPECIFQDDSAVMFVACCDPESDNFEGPCSKRCTTPTGEKS